MLDDDTRRRVLRCLLVSQRHSWDQGLTAAVLDGDGEDAALRVLVDDAVARQLPDGRLAELDPACSVNGGVVGEHVDLVARRLGDADLAAAAARQWDWLLHRAPRAADGTLFHLVGGREVWADTVSMVVPPLAAAGHGDARRYAATGRSLLAATVASLDPLGRVTGAAAAPRFDSPGRSPEAQALLLLADAAARRLGGPHTSAATSAAQPHDRVTPAPPWP